MPKKEKILLLQKRIDIFITVKDYINSHLNPSKVNFFDPSRNDFRQVNSISEVLAELIIEEKDYENALRISDNKDVYLHLRRPSDSYFLDKYFYIGLLAWEANMKRADSGYIESVGLINVFFVWNI